MVANIGFGNLVNTDRVLAVVRSDAAPVKRLIAKGKTENTVIDATQGRKTKSVIVTDGGIIVLSALQVETLNKRLAGVSSAGFEEQDE